MCIAIALPAEKRLSKGQIKNCHRLNDDGIGIMYAYKDKLVIEKTLDLPEFEEDIYPRAIKNAPTSQMVVHFRLSTGGLKDLSNVHPFLISKGLGFVHNGSIYRLQDDPKKEKCDTVRFMEQVLQHLPFGWEKNSAIKTLIEDRIGLSKLITMDNQGHIEIFNENAGHWKDGIWWSNYSYVDGMTPHGKYTGKSESQGGFGFYANAGAWSWRRCPACKTEQYMQKEAEACSACRAVRRFAQDRKEHKVKRHGKLPDNVEVKNASTPGLLDMIIEAAMDDSNYLCQYCDCATLEGQMRVVETSGGMMLMCRNCLNEYAACGLEVISSEILSPRHYTETKELDPTGGTN